MYREEWLTLVAKEIEPLFAPFDVKPYRATCGWPSVNGLGTKNRRIGECHSPKSTKAGVCELFISPTLDEPLDVAGCLTHELGHVVAGVEAKHGKDFVKVCKRVGLTNGKPRVVLPGPELSEKLRKIIEKVGHYPHVALVPLMKPKKASNSVSLECQCGCRCTMGIKWLEEVGKPTCACGQVFTEKVKQ